MARLLHTINPECLLVGPAAGIDGLLASAPEGGANRLTIALTGTVMPLEDVRAQLGTLFPGWIIESAGAA